MKLHSSLLPGNHLSLLLLGLLGSQTAFAITIPHVANCYHNNDNGYDLYIANNSAFASLQANNIYSGTYYKNDTGKFVTTPPSSVAALTNGAFCYYDKSDYSGNWVSYTIGGYSFELQLWGSGDNYYLNLSPIGSSWTKTDGTKCPGETNWAASISAVDSNTAQTICNSDYIVNIATAGVGGKDNGVIMTITDNRAANAGGSQTTGSSASSSSASSSNGRSLAATATAATAAESGRYVLASHILNKTRWSVVRDPETLALSGMSYTADGLKHDKFVHCTFIQDDGNADIYSRQSTYDCEVAEPCTSQQCGSENWQVMTEVVTLPGTFFERPPVDDPDVQFSIPPTGGDVDIRKALELLPESTTQRKIHQTPDGAFKLISVNLQGHEWLLGYDGAQMFGVIPHGAMGQPRFLHCQQTTETANEVTLDCLEAYRCHFGPCTDEQWSPVSSVTLAKSFFDVSATSPNTDALITHYYQSILDRTPDLMGFAYWQNVIANTQAQGGYVAQVFRDMGYFFFNSPEYLGMNKSDTAYVEDLYQTFFQRQPDPSGQAFWLDQLGQGVSRNEVMAGFLYSVEFREYMASLGI